MKAKVINSFSGEFNGKATLHYKNNILEIIPSYDSLAEILLLYVLEYLIKIILKLQNMIY